jgi:hypothetical protein
MKQKEEKNKITRARKVGSGNGGNCEKKRF